jgi:hypothetical protein
VPNIRISSSGRERPWGDHPPPSMRPMSAVHSTTAAISLTVRLHFRPLFGSMYTYRKQESGPDLSQDLSYSCQNQGLACWPERAALIIPLLPLGLMLFPRPRLTTASAALTAAALTGRPHSALAPLPSLLLPRLLPLAGLQLRPRLWRHAGVQVALHDARQGAQAVAHTLRSGSAKWVIYRFEL